MPSLLSTWHESHQIVRPWSTIDEVIDLRGCQDLIYICGKVLQRLLRLLPATHAVGLQTGDDQSELPSEVAEDESCCD